MSNTKNALVTASGGHKKSAFSSYTPLMALDVVALGLKATHTDVKMASIIQLGAVKVLNGKIDERYNLDRLMNPMQPISQACSQAHGLRDHDVIDQPDFSHSRVVFETFLEGHIVISHQAELHLSALKNTYALLGLDWQKPRILNTRFLSRLVAPMLADHSLSAMVKWFGISLNDEHTTALQEAKLTAQVFLKLLPLLRHLDVRTLKQAELACQSFSSETAYLLPPEWKMTEARFQKSLEEDEEKKRADRQKIEPFLYQKRVRDVMTTPAYVFPGSMMLSEVLDILLNRKISSVFIKTDQDQNPYGILTERDALRALRVNPQAGLQMPISHFMTTPLKTIHEREFAYRALGRMQGLSFRHLGVLNDEGHLIGALTPKNLVLSRSFKALQIGDGIAQADTVEELGRVWGELPFLARSLLTEDMDARDIASVISQEICNLTHKATYFAEMKMLARGRGKAPCEYCVLVLGSAGRGESLLAMEQDHAIIYNGKMTHDVWFEELGGHISDILNAVGIVPCQNRIMSVYPDWRKTTEDWTKTVHEWMVKTDPRDLLYVDVFFDARPVYGNLHLGKGLMNEAYGLAVNTPRFQKMLASISGDLGAAFNFFGKLKREGGRVDLKKGGLLGLTAAIRVLALRYNILNRSTRSRIAALTEQDDLSSGDLESLDMAHRYLMNALLHQQLDDIEKGRSASNLVDIKSLDNMERKKIIWALRQLEKIRLAVTGMGDLL